MGHRILMTLLILGFFVPSARIAAATLEDHPLRLAVLTDEKLRSSPLAELVQSAILTELPSDALSFVERYEVGRLTQEQGLSSAFAADQLGERVKLGRLLKADMLVILRAVGTTSPGVEVVACETEHGLRLAVQPVMMEKELSVTAASVKKVVLAAVKKRREHITEIVAITPFVCHDLTFEFEHLKSVYARVLEQSLLARPGVLVVELSEANAIAGEAVLAGHEISRRPLPLFVYGEYRTELVGLQRTVKISMSLKRGDHRLAAIETAAISLDEAAGILESRLSGWMGELVSLEKAGSAAPTTLAALPQRAGMADDTSKREAEQLAERAMEYERAAYWEEASALYEASLLLDGTHTELHRKLSITLHQAYLLHKRQYPTLDALRSNFAVYGRALDHLELYIRAVSSPPSVQKTLGIPYQVLDTGPGMLSFRAGIKLDFMTEVESMAARTRETALRFIPIRARSGHHADVSQLFSWVASVSQWKPAERYARMQKIIDEIQDFPNAGDCVFGLVYYGNDVRLTASPEGQAFIKRLTESTNANVRQSGERLVNALPYVIEFVERSEVLLSRKNARPATLPAGPDEITYKPLRLAVGLANSSTEPAPSFQNRGGCLPVSNGVDVFWTGGQLFIMKQKGILNRVWRTDEPYATLRDVYFDGKYVWAALVAGGLNKNPEPLVLALDPATEEVIKFTATDGLPPIGYRPGGSVSQYAASYISVGLLEQGKACACGSMGKTWIAVLEITSHNGKTEKAVRVFHEAGEAGSPEDKQRWTNTHLAFVPDSFLPVIDSKTGRRTLLLNRSNNSIEGNALQIDCQTLDVQPWGGQPLPKYTLARGYLLESNALYYLNSYRVPTDRLAKMGLFRAELPDLKPVCISQNVSADSDWPRLPFHCTDGRWLLLNDRIGIHGADSERGPFHVLRGGMPDLSTRLADNMGAALWQSHHYGVIFRSTKNHLYQVSFEGAP